MSDFAKISVLDHLNELRRRLMFCVYFFVVVFGISYAFAEDIYYVLALPLKKQLIFTALTEAFLTYVKLAMFMAVFVTFPFFAIQIYKFLAPGLYAREKRAILPFLAASPVLFYGAAAVVYFVVIPAAWQFFMSFENPDMVLQPKVNEYLSLTMHLIIGFGIAFQMPIVLMLLVKTGLIKNDSLRGGRRYAVVIITIISAILTPPDVVSQLVMSLSLYILYEASIWLSRK
jgi:sec-independent protein translocase protein TatC